MARIDLTIKKDRLEHAVERARQRNIIIPTFEEQIHPELVPGENQKGVKVYRFMGYSSAKPLSNHLEK